jgi:UDP-N-acetyl-D-mannosaminuronic acid dehydrogenase
MIPSSFSRDVCIIGGGGHVGLPLAITFAGSGLRTLIYDINATTVELIRRGLMPFSERGADEMLRDALSSKLLEAENTPERLAECEFVVLIVGTPVDEHLNPNFSAMRKTLDRCWDHLRDGQILVLRSTIYPGISEQVQTLVRERGLDIGVSFCPERVAQGHSLAEFRELPQIISAFDEPTLARVRDLFSRFACELVELTPMEAELAKLMTNAWRYIQFATVNQFYMIASEHDVDFGRILHACRYNYPRMAGMPGPGFSAGPCLRKDTMQLAAFSQNSFVLGHAAMLINEGLPAHVISLAKRQRSLREMTAGILGMAFKAESDDPRDSLSYKLRKLLSLEARRVVCTDPYVKDPSLVPIEEVLDKADILFIGTPHSIYRELSIPAGKEVVDIWGVLDRTPGSVPTR